MYVVLGCVVGLRSRLYDLLGSNPEVGLPCTKGIRC